MSTMTVSEARANMREALERVKKGEEIEITQNGEVVAVWLHPSKLRYRARTEAIKDAELLLEKLREAREAPLELKGSYTQEDAEAHIREIREGRDYDVWERVEAELKKEKPTKSNDAPEL
jgi:antitoxin (DNA-binding transcriptional repressor) of toxin-antitoxin stability system